MIVPTTDAQRLYKQWQDGKLLDVEERRALRPDNDSSPASNTSFADLLKNAAEHDS